MKNNFKWHKELIDGKWYSVCDHEHVPMIEHTKDDKYKVRNCNGKAILHQDFASAEKLAIETYKKFEKFNKSFEVIRRPCMLLDEIKNIPAQYSKNFRSMK